MADPNFQFNPPTGHNDVNEFPTNPAKETVRGLFQKLHDQTRDFINLTLIPWTKEAITASESAETKADAAVATANTADGKADSAVTTAGQALTIANAADGKADTAITDSGTALTKATAVETDYTAIKPELEAAVAAVAGKADVAYVNQVAADFQMGKVLPDSIGYNELKAEVEDEVKGNTTNIANLAGEGRTTETVKGNADAINAHLADVEYQTPTIVGTQIQLARQSGTKRLYFYLNGNLTGGAITISLDAGATSLPLKDIDGVVLTSLDKGYWEVVDNTTFFTLRPRGGAKLDGIVSAIEAWGGTVAEPKKADEVVAAIENVASWDPDLTPANIRLGKTVLGVTGTLVEGIPYATGSVNFGTQGAGTFTLPFAAVGVIVLTSSSPNIIGATHSGRSATQGNGIRVELSGTTVSLTYLAGGYFGQLQTVTWYAYGA